MKKASEKFAFEMETMASVLFCFVLSAVVLMLLCSNNILQLRPRLTYGRSYSLRQRRRQKRGQKRRQKQRQKLRQKQRQKRRQKRRVLTRSAVVLTRTLQSRSAILTLSRQNGFVARHKFARLLVTNLLNFVARRSLQ